VFFEVNFDEETRVLLEGAASGAIGKGAGGKDAIPDHALDNIIDLVRRVSAKVATEVAPVVDGTLCTFELTFGVRSDGNGTVMIAQEPENSQFRVTIKRPVINKVKRGAE
jgi:hypothetical protein